jgi:MFS family permease
MGPALLGLTMTIGRFWGQRLTARLSELRMIEGAAVMAVTGTVVAALATSPAMAYAGFALLGLGVSVIGPLGLALVGRLVAPRHRTAAIARVAVVGFLGFFLAPAVVGFIAHASSLPVAFLAVAGLVAALPALTRMLRARFGA